MTQEKPVFELVRRRIGEEIESIDEKLKETNVLEDRRNDLKKALSSLDRLDGVAGKAPASAGPMKRKAPNRCPKCGRPLKPQGAHKHIAVCGGPRADSTLKCNQCGEQCDSAAELRLHKKHAHHSVRDDEPPTPGSSLDI